MSNQVTAAEILVDCLLANGVSKAFCVPGESYLAVLDSLYDKREEIDLITARQDGGAATMAEAYGKLTGRPGICFVTRGPGATNASIGVHTAFQDSSPMILFIGQVARDQRDREAFQEVDYRQMFGPLAKWVGEIDRADRVAEYVTRAFHLAQNGRPGPVVLALPEDMLRDMVPKVPIAPATINEAAPDTDSLAALRSALEKAAQPLVILGGSGWNGQAVEDIKHFIEANNLPVTCSFRRQHLYDHRLDHYVGDVGIGINPKLAERIAGSDLIISIGARLGEMASNGYSHFDIPLPQQKIIMVHVSADELGHVYRPFMTINAHVNQMARALKDMPPVKRDAWQGWRDDARTDYLDWNTPVPTKGDVDLGAVYEYLRDHTPDNAILANGAGNFTIWLHRFFQYKKFPSQLAPTNGAMGYGLPAAVAAKVACPDRPVICFTGDGCFMMTGQELATLKLHDLPIVILLFNNGIYGTIRMHQEKNYPGRVIATDLANPDFTALAKAYGLNGVRVTKTEEFAPAFEAALRAKTTTLIEVMVDPDVITPTKSLEDIRKGL